MDGDRSPATLKRTADLAAQTFESAEAAIAAVLQVLQELTGMRSVFLTETSRERNTLRVVAVRNSKPAVFTVPDGLEIRLDQSP